MCVDESKEWCISLGSEFVIIGVVKPVESSIECRSDIEHVHINRMSEIVLPGNRQEELKVGT